MRKCRRVAVGIAVIAAVERDQRAFEGSERLGYLSNANALAAVLLECLGEQSDVRFIAVHRPLEALRGLSHFIGRGQRYGRLSHQRRALPIPLRAVNKPNVPQTRSAP